MHDGSEDSTAVDPMVEALRVRRLREHGRAKLVVGVLLCAAAAALWVYRPDSIVRENGRLKIWLYLVSAATLLGPGLVLAGVRNLRGQQSGQELAPEFRED